MKKILKFLLLMLLGQHLIAQDTDPTWQELTMTMQQMVYDFQCDPVKARPALAKFIDQSNEAQRAYLIQLAYRGYNNVVTDQGARVGTQGNQNRSYIKRYNRRFMRNTKKHIRDSAQVVLIEGDSWYNFPVPGKSDLTKMLYRQTKKAWIYTNSYGGDWLSTKISEQTYLAHLKQFQPNIFLLGGGGNDMVAENLSKLVCGKREDEYLFPLNKNKYKDEKSKTKEAINIIQEQEINDSLASISSDPSREYNLLIERYFTKTYEGEYGFTAATAKDMAEIKEGFEYLNKRFIQRMMLLELQYRLVLTQVREMDPGNKMTVVTQGYDNPIPDAKPASWITPYRALLNRVVQSSEALYAPMKVKGINDLETQRKVMKAMMFFFNKTLVILAYEKDNDGNFRYPQLVHLDSRGLVERMRIADGKKGYFRYWFDELHPKGRVYGRMVDEIKNIMNTPTLYKTTKRVVNTPN